MDSNSSQSQRTLTASPASTREESSPATEEEPPLAHPDVRAADSPILLDNDAATVTNPASATPRRTAGPALPPMPVPAVTCVSSPSPAAVTITPAVVPSHGTFSSTSTPGSLSISALHPIAAVVSVTTPHVHSSPSLETNTNTNTNSQSGGGSAREVSAAAVEPEAEPFLTNGSIALAEFTSLLKPAENTNVLREHIMHLLRNVDAEDTLVRIARTLEAQQEGGAHSLAEVSSTTWTESSRMSPTMTNASHSTAASALLSTKQSRRSSAMSRHDAANFETLAGFSFLRSHRRATDVNHSPSSHLLASEDAAGHTRSTPGGGGPMEVSYNSQSSHLAQDPDSRRMSKHKSHDETSSSLTATRTSQLSESTTAALCVDPLQHEVPVLPTAVRGEGRRVAVSAAPCEAPPGLLDDSVGDANVPPSAQPPPPLRVIAKTPAEEQQLRSLVRRCHTFANLEADVLEDVVRAMEKEVHAAGTAILEQGQDSTEKMYLVGEGACEAIKNGKSMGSLQSGGTFGELELMYKQAKCAATIRCVTRCVLYSLDEVSYHRAVMSNSLQKRKKFENLTLSVPFLRCMPDFERMKIAEALVTREYRRGQAIIKFGAAGTYMHFIVEGEVKVVGRNNGRRVEVVRLHAGDVVGELEFLFHHLTVADVIVTSPTVVTACISRDHFELIVGPVQDRLKEFVATSATYKTYYLHDVADESVRSDLHRIQSIREHRRVASKDESATLEDVNAHGEVLLSAPLALLHGEGKPGPDGSPCVKPERNDGAGTMTPTAEGLDEAACLPRGLLRFPFAPVTGKDVAVLAMREDGLIVYWNAVLERLTNYSAEEVVGQNIYSFLLAEREQHSMLKAITTARDFAGDVDTFLEERNSKASTFTLARSDGLTSATVELTVVPPMVSAGGDAAEVVLGFGEEVKQGPQKMLEQPQWLSAQIRSILADGTQTFEERLECIAETLNNFEATYRAMTVSTECLRVVNIRQMVGHVLMDFGSDFVTRGVSVRQRFEGLPSERAYLNADLLPECLRYAMLLCLKFSQVGGGVVTIMITVAEKNGLEFLIINFNLAGDGLPEEIASFFDTSFGQHSASAEDDTSGDEAEEEGDEEEENNLGSANATPRHGLPPRLRRKLRRVQRAVEDQGGTLRIQRNPDDANIVFLIPFMPAGDHDVENASVAESLHALIEPSSRSVSLTNLPAGAATSPGLPATVPRAVQPGAARLPPGDHNEDIGSVSAPVTPGDESGLMNGSSGPNQPSFCYTTCLAEDTPAHRIMISSFLWERRHAVLTAFKFEDVVKLFGVADILIIDLQQSVINSLHDEDPISRLREMLRHMAVIITSTSFDLASSDTYEAAGFITLKKPCTPVLAMKAIRRAEEKSAVVKLERMRIEQTRETLARNSRGAWRRGVLLGKGSFGEVYEAFDVLTGGKMAVKEMRLGGNDAKIEQFAQEISTMCNLQHPNIIHYFYCEESEEHRVLRVFMEFAGGGTLQSLLKKKGKLEFTELRALLQDVVEGLAYIHSQHYVHCDIKTANVLLSAEGKGKIGDFGTAHTVHDGELLYVMQGSPLYMSPECMSAGEEDEDGHPIGYSFPSDIWSLGCVAMEMVTTKPPFSHVKDLKGPAGLTNYITSLTDVPDLSPLFKCEPCVVEFVSACLNPDPAQRATAQELLQMSLFSESTPGDNNSAVKALKRAQLRHVLSKFVAFQEPEEVHEMQRRRDKFRVRRRSSDFFSSSASAASERVSSSSFSATVASLHLPGFSKNEKGAAAVAAGKPKSTGAGDDSDVEAPQLRSATAVPLRHGGGSDGTSKNADGTPAAVGDDADANQSSKRRDGGTTGSKTLRRWHSSSSSSLSDHPFVHEDEDGGALHATSTSVPSMNSAPLTEATIAGTGGELHTPPRHGPHRDPQAGADDDGDGEDEPEPRMPTSDDAYDLSPTPKKRSTTQSRPAALREQQQRSKAEKHASSRRRPQRQRSSRESSGGSTSTNSNEAAFFATSSESSSRDDGIHENSHPSNVVSTEELTAHVGKTPVAEAAAVTAIVGTPLSSAEAVKTVAAMTVGEAVVTNLSSNPLSVSPERDPGPGHGTVAPAVTHGDNDPSSTLLPSAMPTFTGRRRNVTLDEEGNIVPFEHSTGPGNAPFPPERREAGVAGSHGVTSPKPGTTAAATAAAASLHDDASPMSASGEQAASPPVARTGYPAGSPPSTAIPPPATNVSFTHHPPNFSFYNYSFNKNISFMGANIEEVLSNAANDFLNNLAAASNGSLTSIVHAHVPTSNSIFSVDAQPASSLVAERRGSTHSSSSHHDADAHVDNVPPLSSHMESAAATAAARRDSNSPGSPPDLSASATLPVHHNSGDHAVATAEGEKGIEDAGKASHSGSRHDSPPPQVPRFSPAPQRSARSIGSAGNSEATSTSPRSINVPLVGANASMARRPARARPPITNQSFFVVEDRDIPLLGNGSITMSSTPFFALTGAGVNSSVVGANATASVAPVSATSFPNGAAAGSGRGGSVAGESASSIFRQNQNVAVVAPAPLFSTFAFSAAARDAWRHRHRFGNSTNNNNSIAPGSSRTVLSNSNEYSPYSRSRGENHDNEHEGSRSEKGDNGGVGTTSVDDAVVAVAPAEGSLYDEAPLSSAAFESARSISSRQSSQHGDSPYLTVERLQQVTGPAPYDSHSSDEHGVALPSSLASPEAAPLFAHLKRLHQSLIDVAAQLHARQRRSNTDVVTRAGPDSAAGGDPRVSPSLGAQSSSQVLSPVQHPRLAAVSAHSTHSPLLPMPPFLPPSSASASVVAVAEGSLGAVGSRGGRPSLPRPVSSFQGSLTASTTKPTRTTPLLGSQLGRSNPLWPADEEGEDHRSSSSSSGTEKSAAASSSSMPPSQTHSSTSDSAAVTAPATRNAGKLRGYGSDGDGVMSSSGSGSGSGGGGAVEALLQKTLQQVSKLMEQISHLPPPAPPPSRPAIARGVEGTA
ncbi:putative protein kinase [Leptomonas pyrrhocoris]|uniref:Protein kinase n=1 Tax=Leptomonas pyrrhocoris TaxID=157538 RepID=A0A0M9FSQ5_LEPPY|nr:putative protein kinase [Leptomonas pyrrhocoris]KPA75086.1 putative protein kinase [Leptomonas pyrrhocoris]|eukprot:XP_015653525.1 putative protein kinase [Leptomonas pyrrhocoris]